MVTFVPKFVNERVRAWDAECLAAAAGAGVDHRDHVAYSAFQEDWSRTRPQPPSSVEDVVAHLEHVREVAGMPSIGLGGDYDGVARQPSGLEDVTGYPRLLARLAERGWSRDDLAALTSGNILRVMERVAAVAKSLSATGPDDSIDPLAR